MDTAPRLPAIFAACSALLTGGAVVPTLAIDAADAPASPRDAAIDAAVRRELMAMTRSTTLAIDVQAVDGVVRLAGQLPEDIDVAQAIAAVRGVAGVRGIDATRLSTRADRRH